jgi:predicted RNA binding protein YcfA (HicA-like mRNA interferase family)
MSVTIERAAVIRNLPKKGFRKDTSGDHIYFYHEHGGKETGIKTHVSHSVEPKVIARGLMGAMKRQLRLERPSQLVDLVECRLDGDAYANILREQGLFED